MVKRQAQNKSLKDRLNRSKVRDEVRYKEAEAPKGGGAKIPADVNGIAKVTKISFPTAKKGDYAGNQLLYVGATVVEPTEAVNEHVKLKDGTSPVVKIEGSLLDIRTITLADTKDYEGNEVPFEENFAEAENRLKLLGIPTEEIDDDDFEDTVTAYPENEDLYIRFRTWGRNITKQDGSEEWRVFTVIEGPAEDYVPTEVDDMTEEGDEEEEEEAPKPKPKTTKPNSAAKGSKTSPKAPGKPTGKKPSTKASEPEEAEEEDWEALGEAADEGDANAEQQLIAAATEAGVDYESADSWADVGKELAEGAGEEEEEEGDDEEEEEYEDADEGEEEESEYVPAKEDVVMYKFKGTRKAVMAEVTAVNTKLKTVSLSAVDSDKKATKVSWDDVEEA